MMPNAKILEEKKALVASLVEKIKNSPAGVLVDYKGINVEDDTKLRKQLREAGVEYAVIKNTLIRFAAKELGFDELDACLHGTTALAISTTDDVVAPAKILADFAKTHENFTLKAGYLEGKAIGEDEHLKGDGGRGQEAGCYAEQGNPYRSGTVQLQLPHYAARYCLRCYR